MYGSDLKLVFSFVPWFIDVTFSRFMHSYGFTSSVSRHAVFVLCFLSG